ncbi:IS607 family transposase [Moorena producens]|uniref:IS607 family transposase n=1 Tax=Moorena producens TaxID=1155739 RepID=UPI0009F34F4B|nr:IS607 family transposase [Moorena producens]
MRYKPPRKACELLAVSEKTLRNWEKAGKIKSIRTPSNQRRYDVDSVLGRVKDKPTIIYARVSTRRQKEDLERQAAFLQGKFPEAEVIKDIGTGLNYRRKGLKALLGRVLSRDVSEIVVAHKDRMARFGFELIEWICEQNGCRIVVLDQSNLSDEREMVEDILAIVHVFSCRLYGLRKYKSVIKEDPSLPGN